jgi:hypothetical protein
MLLFYFDDGLLVRECFFGGCFAMQIKQENREGCKGRVVSWKAWMGKVCLLFASKMLLFCFDDGLLVRGCFLAGFAWSLCRSNNAPMRVERA